ncbi:MAG TPA: quercetin 2,3-dioxygenase [Thermoleophilaceae bacterium]|jgi:quercetin dioxygenase-like cupin family protein
MTIIRAAGEGEPLWFANSLMELKAGSEETGGAFLLFELRSSRGKVTPLHSHPTEDESIYVLEGELLIHDDGTEHRAREGSFVCLPRGTPHAFMVTSETARFLTLLTPGPAAAEAFYRAGGDPAPRRERPPQEPLDIGRIKAAAERSGAIEVLGPPPFAAAGAPA